MRLLAIIEAHSITGPAKNLLEFAACAQGVELTIASFLRGGGSNLFLETARRAGIPVEVIPERGLFDRSVPGALRAAAGRSQPDIVQTHAVKSHFVARLAGLPALAPWIAFHHGYTWPKLRVRAYNQLDRWSLRAANRVVTVSQPFRDQIVARGVPPDRIDVVHNAIRQDWGAAARNAGAGLRASLGIPPGRKVILIVGRLSREKDHLTLLRAVARLASDPSHSDPHLVLVGEGPERPHLERAALSLGLAGRTTFTGQVDSAEPYYGIADAAVLSSLTEGSPNALLEAMAAGVPVVATAVGGVPEIVTDRESALLVRVGDVESMARSLGELLGGDPALAARLASGSLALIRDRHTPEARARRLLEIYRSVMRTPARAS
jgi:glycosyltransferase involved in cell wall biosynthesis